MGELKGPEFYNEKLKSPKYTTHYASSPYIVLWQEVCREIAKFKVPWVFELGCGTGQFAHMLYDQGVRKYRGVDFSATGVARAAQNCPLDFQLGDLRDPAIYVGKYNCVVALEVLEHLEDDLAVFDNLAFGVKFIASVPLRDSESHVRHFPCKEEVVERYLKFLGSMKVRKINKWWLVTGKLRA